MPVALVADNDPGVRVLLADLVRRAGFEVRLAVDGRAAREQLAEGGIHLLICDLDMPQLSGQQVIASLAELPGPPSVLVVSGYVDAAIEREIRAHPFVAGVLRKPFDVLAFLARVREFARSLAAPNPAAATVLPNGASAPAAEARIAASGEIAGLPQPREEVQPGAGGQQSEEGERIEVSPPAAVDPAPRGTGTSTGAPSSPEEAAGDPPAACSGT